MRKHDMKPTYKRRKLKLVLCLCGHNDIGKSETLIAIARSLLEESRFYYEQKGQNDSHDRRVVLKYQGRIIGICTGGDDVGIIKDNFSFFKYAHCEIGIMAVRDNSTQNRSLIKHYVRRLKQTKFVFIHKVDYTISYAQQLAIGAYVDLVKSALSKKKFKEMYKQLKDAERDD